MSYEFSMFAQQGWQCPICRRVYSPSTPMCWYCGNGETITTNNINIKMNNEQKTPSTDTEWLKYLTKTYSDQTKE